ncbi:MAG: enoyl-CoA hydratase/isomerase family protein [Gemmatimonadota bacterium]|nr:MAG: enoyl-CoA hydratase/isomerase family protein [Gemmatimonadota bacterium]
MQGGIAVVRLARPPVNAVDLGLAGELERALDEVAGDARAQAVVLAGSEGCFSAGLDLKALPAYGPEEQRELVLGFGRALVRLYAYPRPVVAAVDGHAIAGGLILAIACDYRVGGRGAYRFGLTEVRVGVPFPLTPLELVRAELRPEVARRLVLGSATEGPEAALGWGALDELVRPGAVEARALEVAAELAQLPPRTYGRTKHLLRGAAIARMEEGLQRQADRAASEWLTPETALAAARVLRGD